MAQTSARLIAIGDVHGCAHALDTLLAAIKPRPRDELVFLGDLIDQGRDTRDVLERLIDLDRACRVVLIEGNHEEMLYAARHSEQALRYWENCGGANTLNSYRYGGGVDVIPRAHWELLDRCRPYYETGSVIFTHANYLPDVPMGLQPDHQLRWALLEPAEMRPHVSGKTVIVGHTEQPSSEVLDLGFVVCIDTACWRHGWLTALDVASGQIWQASRFGMLRDRDEPAHRGRLVQLAGAAGA
jgi:serine/threonine protein phosphatase 1